MYVRTLVFLVVVLLTGSVFANANYAADPLNIPSEWKATNDGVVDAEVTVKEHWLEYNIDYVIVTFTKLPGDPSDYRAMLVISDDRSGEILCKAINLEFGYDTITTKLYAMKNWDRKDFHYSTTYREMI